MHRFAMGELMRQFFLPACLLCQGLYVEQGFKAEKNTYHPGPLTALGQNLFHPVFLLGLLFADEFNFDSRFGRYLLCVLAKPVEE